MPSLLRRRTSGDRDGKMKYTDHDKKEPKKAEGRNDGKHSDRKRKRGHETGNNGEIRKRGREDEWTADREREDEIGNNGVRTGKTGKSTDQDKKERTRDRDRKRRKVSPLGCRAAASIWSKQELSTGLRPREIDPDGHRAVAMSAEATGGGGNP